ncbi:helix-turn-helix domain-containing protein [Ktedonosporobacter rubrisoli]|nr:AraC family transcriptional regulator [Ktedonosporobacter rubrisoli]
MLEDPLATPKLLVSSQEADWDELALFAYHEPRKLEGWIDPATLDSSLVLIRRGGVHLEEKPTGGPWEVHNLYEGEWLLKPGELQSRELRWHSLSREPLHMLYIYLRPTLLTRTAQEMAKGDPARLTLIGHAGFQDPLLTQIGLALWHELEQPAPAKLYAQTAAQMLAVHLLHHYTSHPGNLQEETQGLNSQQLKHIRDFILAHLSQDLSLETLAQQVGFSAYHFARVFRQATGESPHQFVLGQRIEHAKKLLRETDMPLTLVALESGFASQSHLNQAFKRRLNLTPRSYRYDQSIRAHF